MTYQRNETPEPLASGVENAIDEAGYTLLSDLAGIDCYDTNLRDQPEAYAALDRYREACAKAATPAPGAPGQEALQNSAPRRIYLDIGDPFVLEGILAGTTDWQVEGVTWSEDNATSHGVEYVRADLAALPAGAEAAHDAALAGEKQE